MKTEKWIKLFPYLYIFRYKISFFSHLSLYNTEEDFLAAIILYSIKSLPKLISWLRHWDWDQHSIPVERERRESQNLCYLKLENIISPQMFPFDKWSAIKSYELTKNDGEKWDFFHENINIALEWYSVILLWATGSLSTSIEDFIWTFISYIRNVLCCFPKGWKANS